VLAEPDVAAADAVVLLLGDIALGPMPAQTLEVLAGLVERAIWVHSNCEPEMVAAFDGVTVPGPNGSQACVSAALISRRHRDLLGRGPVRARRRAPGRHPGSVGMPYGPPGAHWANSDTEALTAFTEIAGQQEGPAR
jgi:hypothetical protein